MNHPEREDTEDDGSKAFKNKDPSPAWLSANALHLLDGSREQSAKGTSNSGCAEEDGSPDPEFGALVPTGEVVVYSGE